MSMSQQSIQCLSCGTRYATRHQLTTDLNGKSCSNCGTQIFAHLYHQISSSDANSITSTQHMKPAKKGIAGPGIYFATNPYTKNDKSKNVGYGGDKSLNGQKGSQQGYNLVHIPRNGGWYGAQKGNTSSSEEESQHSQPAKNKTNEDNTDAVHFTYKQSAVSDTHSHPRSSIDSQEDSKYNKNTQLLSKYDNNKAHIKSSSSSYDTHSQSTDIDVNANVLYGIGNVSGDYKYKSSNDNLKHNISSRADSSLNANQSSSVCSELEFKSYFGSEVISNLNISSNEHDNNKTHNQSSPSSYDYDTNSHSTDVSASGSYAYGIGSVSVDVSYKSSKSRAQSNDNLKHNILSRSDSSLNENQPTSKRYKATSDSGSEAVSNLNISSNEYDNNKIHNKSSSRSQTTTSGSYAYGIGSVCVNVSHYLKHNISSRSNSSVNVNQSNSKRYEASSEAVSNLNISSNEYDNHKTHNKSSSSSHDTTSQSNDSSAKCSYEIGNVSVDVSHKSSKSHAQSNDNLTHNISSRSYSSLNENQSNSKRYKATSDSESEAVSNLNISSNEYDKNKSSTSSSQLENNKITPELTERYEEGIITLQMVMLNLRKLLTLADQLKSNEAFQKELSSNSNLIVEYTTGNETNDSSSTQSNDSSSTGESKRNSDENSDNSNDDSSHDEKDNNNHDEHDEKGNNNDSNEDHKCTMDKYHCNVSWHAVRLKQLEEENKKLKLLLKQQTTVDDTNDCQSYDTIVDVQKNKKTNRLTTTNFKVTRKLTKTIMPTKTDESFCNAFDYMNQFYHIHRDVIEDYKCDEKEVKIIDCGIQCKNTKERLYVVCEKQNKLWKTNDDLYSNSEIQQIYKISKQYLSLPVIISDKTIAVIKNAKEHVTRILQNKTHRNVMIGSKHTPWNNEDKIPVFNKTTKQNGLTLILEKHQFVQKLKTFADKNVNDIQLIPIVRFNNENKYFYEIAWIVEIGTNINIAISFKHIKNKYLPSAIYLDIHDAHKLVVYKHNCDCLTNFICFIDQLQIGENRQTRMHQQYKRKMEQKINEQENQINKQQNQIDEHANQMQNYLRLREQDMLIIDDMKLTCENLQSDLQSLKQLQGTVNEQQKACNRLHELNTLNTLTHFQTIPLNPLQVCSNQLTTQFNNLNSNQQQ